MFLKVIQSYLYASECTVLHKAVLLAFYQNQVKKWSKTAEISNIAKCDIEKGVMKK